MGEGRGGGGCASCLWLSQTSITVRSCTQRKVNEPNGTGTLGSIFSEVLKRDGVSAVVSSLRIVPAASRACLLKSVRILYVLPR